MKHTVIIPVQQFSEPLTRTLENIQPLRGSAVQIVISDNTGGDHRHPSELGVDAIVQRITDVPTSLGLTINRAADKATGDLLWIMLPGTQLQEPKRAKHVFEDIALHQAPSAMLPAYGNWLADMQLWLGYQLTAVGKQTLPMVVVRKIDFKRVGGCADTAHNPLGKLVHSLQHLGRAKVLHQHNIYVTS